MHNAIKTHALIGVSALVGLSGCAAPFTSARITGDKIETPKKASDSIYYSLPRTDLVVNAKLIKIETKAPKCAELTKSAQSSKEKENLGLLQAYGNAGLDPQKLPQEASLEFGQSELAVTTQARPDPVQAFAIKLEGKAGHNRKLALALGVEGLIAGGNVSAENRGGEIAASVVVDVLSAVATIVGSFFGGEKPPRENINADLQKKPEFEMCYQALSRLTVLSKQRNNVIDGTTSRPPFDIADQLKIIDDERARIERLFTGEKEIHKGGVRCVVDPGDEASSTPVALWSFNKGKGIKPDDANVCVVTPGFDTQASGRAMTLQLSTADAVNTHAQTVGKSYEKSDNKAVIYYRVPGRATIEVIDAGGKHRFGPEVMTIAQYGVVLPLPVPTGNKKVEVSFKLDPQTGALVEVGATTGGDSSAIPKIAEIGKSVGSLGATIQEERNYSDSERVKDMLVDACIEALEVGEWASACEEL